MAVTVLGAIAVGSAKLNVKTSEFRRNEARGGNGTNGARGGNGGSRADGVGGGISEAVLLATLRASSYVTINQSVFEDNRAIGGNGGSGGSGANGGNGGYGSSGLFTGTSTTTTLTAVTIENNDAEGGGAGSGGTKGEGMGGGVLIDPTATAFADKKSKIRHHDATTSDDDVSGTLTPI
jgi:hypothetical protein